MAGVLGKAAHLRLWIDRPELTPLGEKAYKIGIGSRLSYKPIRQVEDFREIAVPGSQPPLLVEPDDTVSHVVEGDAQYRLLLPELGGALLDLLFQTLRRLGALGQQRVAFDRVLTEHLDGAPHCGDLVAAGDRDCGFAAAAGDRKHRAAQQVQPADNIAADITPHNQDRSQEAERDEASDRLSTQSLDT